MASETQVCELCGEECDHFVTLGLGGEEDLCEHCADITTEEYSL